MPLKSGRLKTQQAQNAADVQARTIAADNAMELARELAEANSRNEQRVSPQRVHVGTELGGGAWGVVYEGTFNDGRKLFLSQ